jgi:acyl-homoserine lactone acylase PvdQ
MWSFLIRRALLSACLVTTILSTLGCGNSSSPGGAVATPGGSGSAPVMPLTGPDIVLNVVPPGSNGNSAGGVGAQGATVVQYPANFEDQLALYGDLSYAKQGLQASPCTPPSDSTKHVAASNLACNYYKHEGLTPDTTASTETVTAPSGNAVTITRDNWGVPFIDAKTRADAEFGVGYANAEDRLWLDDILRNLGRGTATKFLGVAPGITDFDVNLAAVAGYSEDELTGMVNATVKQLGAVGPLFLSDTQQFVAGINAYIATLSGANASKVPPEYLSLKPGGFPPAPFNVNDVVASAVLIQSIFATGGGGELSNELLLQHLDANLKPGATAVSADACALWRDLRHADDPETFNTIDTVFKTQSPATLDETCPHALKAGVAVLDPGSIKGFTSFTYGNVGGLPATPAAARSQPAVNLLKALAVRVAATRSRRAKHASPPSRRSMQVALNPVEGAREGLRKAGWSVPNTLSNFVAITAAKSASGHPIAVMGPQTSYFVPQLLWEFAVTSHGGTKLDFNGRGIDFAMLPYIEIGRGIDYAWSATSGESDLIDTRVSQMCNTDGKTTPSRDDANGDGFPDADGYLYDAQDGNGPQCRKFYKRTDTWTATPTPASTASGGPTIPQTVNRYILRTHYGPVTATALVNGVPVAISQQRSTFYAELSTAAPFALASAGIIHDPASFQQVFNGVTGTFNWLYTDSAHLAYVHSGLYPVRDAGVDADLPAWGNGDFEWKADADVINGAGNSGFFTQYGGATPFPNRVVALPQGDVTQTGYFEFKDFLPLSAHPQIVDPTRGYIESWNNHPAPGWWAADSNGTFGSTHRAGMLAKRAKALLDSGMAINFANMVEIEADAAYTDLRAQDVLPLILQLMNSGSLTADQQQVATIMQAWLDGTTSAKWIGPTAAGLAGWRRDRDNDGIYDFRAQVVLMDAWYPHLIDAMLPQMTALTKAGVSALQGRYDAPRAQGSAYQEGWFEHMKRVLEMVMNTPGHTGDYRALKCAGTGTVTDCRAAVLSALDLALNDLGGLSNMAKWDGTQLANPADGKTGETVETYDEVKHTDLSLLSVPPIRWINRPTFQQVVELHQSR